MQESIATASRDLVAIKRRKFSYYAHRGFQELTRRLFGRPEAGSALLYPLFESQASLIDILNRLAWYLPEGMLPADCGIFLSVTDDLDVEAALESTPEGQEYYDGTHLPLQSVDQTELGAIGGEVGMILLWDARARFSSTALRNLRKLEFLDQNFWSGTESAMWGHVGEALRRDLSDDSETLFEQLEDRARDWGRAYVFATGPSLDDAMEFEFDQDSLMIVCNSIVRNEAMLDHIDPDVFVFADPVFHFGPSTYATMFREDAIAALHQYDCSCIIPDQHRSLMAGHYPDVDFIGLQTVGTDSPLFPASADLRVMGTNNVMTMFMLPIASSLAEEVNIIGADGREAGESYFWQHNESAQYTDEVIQTAVDTHPSFFRDRIYTDYYDRHVRTLESMIEYGEEHGVTYHNLTHSYIPCLAERTVEDPMAHVHGSR